MSASLCRRGWGRAPSRGARQPARAFEWLVLALIGLALALFNAYILVQAINLYQWTARSIVRDSGPAMEHGHQIFSLEQWLHIGIEPVIQARVGAWHTALWLLPGVDPRHAAIWIYYYSLPTWMIASLMWAYLFRPKSFARLRDLTLVSTALAVALFQVFPVAPPRFALHAAPYYVSDWTGTGFTSNAQAIRAIGFDPYAAFPSVHLLWALIPAVCLLSEHPPRWTWALAAIPPLLVLFAVIATGNHYLIDCAGALLVLVAGLVLMALSRRVAGLLHGRWRLRAPRLFSGVSLPAAPTMALLCAAFLAESGRTLRPLLALAILLLAIVSLLRFPALWKLSRERTRGVEAASGYDVLAGLLFIGGSAALHPPGIDSRFCAFLWLFACLIAFIGAVRALPDRRVIWLSPVWQRRGQRVPIGEPAPQSAREQAD